MPADSIARTSPLTDGRAYTASYERGMLFWADMDARIRAASNGRRNLDSVMVPLIRRARTLGGDGDASNGARPGGQAGWFTPGELVDSLAKAGGAEVRQVFDSVIVRGRTHRSRGACVRPVLRASTHEAARSLRWDVGRARAGGRRAGSRDRCVSLGARPVRSRSALSYVVGEEQVSVSTLHHAQLTAASR